MRSLFFGRTQEATAEQIAATGAGQWGATPGDTTGFRSINGGGVREVPEWTLERARTFSIAGYRANPMVKAIIDTYTSFCVGDSGLTLQCTQNEVRAVVERFWTDRRNRGFGGDLWLRDHMLMGETVIEPLVGQMTGRVRLSVVDPSRISSVETLHGNPLWPSRIHLNGAQDPTGLEIIDVDDLSNRRSGDVEFWASWQALLTDTRGYPFLGPILDWLDAYDQVIWNLIDRTAMARHLVFDVTVDGDQPAVDAFIKARGGLHAPKSGSVEVHNKAVEWETKTADVGSFEDTNTAKTVLTNIAGGTGLAKTWLADPEDANRATSQTMAEPVRRRVNGVQNVWLAYQNEMLRYVVDQAVAARTLPELVDVSGGTEKVNPTDTVSVTGPEIAAADAQVTAVVLAQLSQGLTGMVQSGLMTAPAAKVAAKKAWEDYAGVPYQPELDEPDGSRTDDLAGEIDRILSTANT